MRCCVSSCVNHRNKLQNSFDASGNRVFFHCFPRDPKQRAEWMESLGIPNWQPTDNNLVCSKHFREEDLYETTDKIVKVKFGRLPTVNPDHFGLAVKRVCKMCLSLDAKMYEITDYNLDKMYEEIIGIPPRIDHNDRLPMSICWECCSRLQSAVTLKNRALQSDALLLELLDTDEQLTVSSIQLLHRVHNIKPTLSKLEVFKYDSRITNQRPHNLDKAEDIDTSDQPIASEEYEFEIKDLISNTVTIKDEENRSYIEKVLVEPSVKTEIDLVPTADVSGTFSDSFTDESVRINDNLNIEFDDVVIVVGDRYNVSVDNDNNDDYNDNDGTDDNNDTLIDDNVKNNAVLIKDNDYKVIKVSSNITKEAVVCLEDIKKVNINKPKPAKRKTIEKDEDDEPIIWVKGKQKKDKKPAAKETKDDDFNEPIIWVKGKPPKKKSAYVKPSIPINENIFSITILTLDRQIREMDERRQCQRYILADYKCTVCYKWFLNNEKLERHLESHNEKSGPFKCHICHVRKKKARELRAHIKQIHTAEYACKLCPLVTRSKNVALAHERYHAGNKYTCPQCGVIFERQTTLLNHLRLKHVPDSVCELCGYTFVNKHGVVTHKRIRHKFVDENIELKGPYCKECDVKFLNEKAYSKHLRVSSKHITNENDPRRLSNDPSIRTRRPGPTTKKIRRDVIRRKDMEDYKNMVVPSEPVSCEQCGEVLENFKMYAHHFKNNHPGMTKAKFSNLFIPYMCEHCGKMFTNITTFTGHMWVHTGQKGFQCDHCNKYFTMKANLAIHMKQHQSVWPKFECHVCKKSFAFKHNLTRHMTIHTGLKPHKCGACEKTFAYKSELQWHIDHLHLGKPWPKRIRHRNKKTEVSHFEY